MLGAEPGGEWQGYEWQYLGMPEETNPTQLARNGQRRHSVGAVDTAFAPGSMLDQMPHVTSPPVPKSNSHEGLVGMRAAGYSPRAKSASTAPEEDSEESSVCEVL